MNAFTAREHTTFVTRLPAAHWRLGTELIGDILSAPALRPHEIDAEREVILEELWAALDTPEDRVHTLHMEGLFPDHPLRSEEHTSELQSLMRISYAVFCLKNKK